MNLNDNPQVSILMPSLNVAAYIRQCLESVISQTLSEIEIICIDAGSTDGTQEILREFAERDPRIQVIHSDKKSYGRQMNLGLDAARGEYIGILETDDWIEVKMFETLYRAASEHNAEIVKSNYWLYKTEDGSENRMEENLSACVYGNLTDAYANRFALFRSAPAIWSGIYRRKMLTEKHIRFNETPGASYQDASFHFLTCATAERVWLLPEAYLHYRQNNDQSSIHSSGKVYAICDEMHFCEAYLQEYREDKLQMMRILMPVKFENYLWNYYRIGQRDQWPFLKKMREEFLKHDENGCLSREYFSDDEGRILQKILEEPMRFYLMTCKAPRPLARLRDAYFSIK